MAGNYQFKFSHYLPLIRIIMYTWHSRQLSIQFFSEYVNRDTEVPLLRNALVVVVLIVLVLILVVVLVLIVVLIVFLIVVLVVVLSAVLAVLRIAVIILIVIVIHGSYLLLLTSYRSSMANSHKKYA